MPVSARLGAALVAVVATVAVVVQLDSISPAGSVANPGVSATPSEAPSISAPAARSTQASTSPPPPTQRFTSAIYGITIEYPEGWDATAGSTPWSMDDGSYNVPLGDLIVDPTHEFLWLKLASTPLGSTPFEQWASIVFEGHECLGVPTTIDIDGAKGLVDFSCLTALVPSDGRGYFIAAHLCPCEIASMSEWRTWYADELKTVRLQPDDASRSN